MALRLIKTVTPSETLGSLTPSQNLCKIHYCPETEEYRVRLFQNGKPYKPADYFTNDKTDAELTAVSMLGA